MLTADEIASRQFLVSLRGYDREEVETFLRQVAGDVARLQEQVRELETELEAARERAEDGDGEGLDRTAAFQSLGEETTRVLVAAEESAAEIRTKAEQHANELVDNASREARNEIQDARQQATRIVAEAEQRRDDIKQRAEDIEEARARLVAELQEAVGAVQDAIQPLEDAAAPTAEPSPDDTSAAAAAGADAPVSAVADEDSEDAVVADREHVSPESTTADAAAQGEAADEAVAAAVSAPPEAEPASPEDVAEELEDAQEPADEAPRTPVGDEPVEDERGERVTVIEEPGEPAVEEPPRSAAAEEVDPISLRQQTLATVRPGMLRRVKRALQDVQNETLTAVREAGGAPELSDIVPAPSDLEAIDSIADMFLTAAFQGGVGDGGVLADEELDVELGDKAQVAAVRDDLRGTLTDETLSALRATLRAGIDAAEPEPLLSERIGEVFRDLKGPVVEAAVDRALMRVHARGLLASWEELGIDEVAWVLADEARCPEGRCRTNDAESPVERGATFPSGQAVPPAHDGCTCALVPVL